MPVKMTEEARKRKASYDSSYVMEHQTQRKIIFNDTVPEDMDMLRWLDSKPNKNKYMKELIREDMLKAGK